MTYMRKAYCRYIRKGRRVLHPYKQLSENKEERVRQEALDERLIERRDNAMSNNKDIQLEEEFIVLAIPSSTIEVTISAKVWKDGEVKEVSRTMPFEEVRSAIEEARDSYIPSDAVFTLTELGEARLEALKERYSVDW